MTVNCQIGIELSKCVYLASMGVKIENTGGGQNQHFLQNAYQPKHGQQ